jgi:hypothetical protein
VIATRVSFGTYWLLESRERSIAADSLGGSTHRLDAQTRCLALRSQLELLHRRPTTLGPLLERATGQSVPDFARDNLLTPPGITRVKWQFPGRVHAARGVTRRERFDITPLLMRHSRVAVSSSMSLKSCAAADRLGLQ